MRKSVKYLSTPVRINIRNCIQYKIKINVVLISAQMKENNLFVVRYVA